MRDVTIHPPHMGVLHEFKKKPSHVKSRYAFLGATVLTLGIGFIWVTTIPARFAGIGESFKESGETQTASVNESFTDLVENARRGLIDSESIPEEEGMYVEGALGDAVPPEGFVSMGGSGALQNLDLWNPSTTQSVEESVLVKPEEGTIASSTAPGTSTTPALIPTVPPPPTRPAVILIGTTTSKKSE